MDGYALRQQDTLNHETFRIVGQSLAGHPYTGSIKVGECARIWKGGCIIRAGFLDQIKQAYQTVARGFNEMV